ncbi:MAG TPA: SgcJ/EcaC family oxidoreductase [Terricaulis sp.]|nr:SgcJ/EcaC family oxidoreductase [Terricaulis sp.]
MLRLFMTIMALAIATPALAQERREIPAYRTYGAPAAPEHAGEIGALVEAFKAAWGAEDTQALMALHAPDVEWINAYARMFQGAEALGAFLEHRLFPAFPAEASRGEAENMRLISTRYLGDDAAVAHLYTEGQRGPSRNEGETARRTHIHLVIARQDDVWRIVHVAIMDARS